MPLPNSSAFPERKTMLPPGRFPAAQLIGYDGSYDAENAETNALFVSNMNWWNTETQVRNLFSKFGTIKKLKFKVEKASGMSKGTAYLEYAESSPGASKKAREETHGAMIQRGKADGLVVTYATPKDKHANTDAAGLISNGVAINPEFLKGLKGLYESVNHREPRDHRRKYRRNR